MHASAMVRPDQFDAIPAGGLGRSWRQDAVHRTRRGLAL